MLIYCEAHLPQNNLNEIDKYSKINKFKIANARNANKYFVRNSSERSSRRVSNFFCTIFTLFSLNLSAAAFQMCGASVYLCIVSLRTKAKLNREKTMKRIARIYFYSIRSGLLWNIEWCVICESEMRFLSCLAYSWTYTPWRASRQWNTRINQWIKNVVRFGDTYIPMKNISLARIFHEMLSQFSFSISINHIANWEPTRDGVRRSSRRISVIFLLSYYDWVNPQM